MIPRRHASIEIGKYACILDGICYFLTLIDCIEKIINC